MINANGKIIDIELSNNIEKRIIDAFMTIFEEKSIEKISIKSITDLAGLNRGTFYLHYNDIHDLLENIEAKYQDISKYIATYSVNALFNNQNLDEILPSKEFYETNLKYYKILLCMDRKSNLPLIIKNELKEAFRSKFENTNVNDCNLNEYALEFITSAQVSTIILWIKNDMILPLKDISVLMQEWSTNGVLNFFKK